MRVLGIDEAGRGCVLGPLFVGGFLVEGVSDEILRQAGATDSKRLSPAKRVAARAALAALGTSDVRAIAPRDIDEGNLNRLEEAVIADLVCAWRPDVVIVDALGHPRSLPAVVARLQAAVPGGSEIRWVMAPGADLDHPVVGAASIFAKTDRDAHLDGLRATWGALGSGYPHDPATRRWLADWAESGRPWPDFVRTRWGTITALAQAPLF